MQPPTRTPGGLDCSQYRFFAHAGWLQEVDAYRLELEIGAAAAGGRLAVRLNDNIATLTTVAFAQALVDSKKPRVYAEMEVVGDGSDWNLRELKLLGDLGFAAPVRIFDNGAHSSPAVHTLPFDGYLLFVPGPLLRNGFGKQPADWAAATSPDGSLDLSGYGQLIERRIFPALNWANDCAARRGRPAFVTMPGIGCGQFAGPFKGRLGYPLRNALEEVIVKYHRRLPWVRAVYFDPYGECDNDRRQHGHIDFMVRPLLAGRGNQPQLCPPRGYEERSDDNFADCDLYSVVAWDHVSWPGNDFFGGSRATDDGVKAAATDVMHATTGVPGAYDSVAYQYSPPPPFATWGELVQARGIRLALKDSPVLSQII